MANEPIVVADAAAATTAARRLSRQGLYRTDLADLPAEPWDLGKRRLFCVVRARETDTAADALMAATRGVRLIVVASAEEATEHAGFLDDLARACAPLPAADSATSADRDGLLGLLVDGMTVTAAADALHVSRRTANRWLAQAQQEFGVDSTAALVRAWAARSG